MVIGISTPHHAPSVHLPPPPTHGRRLPPRPFPLPRSCLRFHCHCRFSPRGAGRRRPGVAALLVGEKRVRGTGSAAAARLGARPAGSWEDDTDAAHAPAAAQSPSPSPLLSPPPPVRPLPGSDDVAAIATVSPSSPTNCPRGLKLLLSA